MKFNREVTVGSMWCVTDLVFTVISVKDGIAYGEVRDAYGKWISEYPMAVSKLIQWPYLEQAKPKLRIV